MNDYAVLDFIDRFAPGLAGIRAAVRAHYDSGVREWSGRRGEFVAVTPDPTTGGAQWRATVYDDRGLLGDWTRADLLSLLDEIAYRGFVDPAPGTFDRFGPIVNAEVEARRMKARR